MRLHLGMVRREWRLAVALILAGLLVLIAISIRSNDLGQFNRQTCDRIDVVDNALIRFILTLPPDRESSPAQVRAYGKLLGDLQAARC